MRRYLTGLATLLLVALPAVGGGEIHGTLVLAGGERLTGPIRWDKNENFWGDRLDAQKARVDTDDNDGFRLRIFGWDLLELASDKPRYGLSIPFGQIAALERAQGDRFTFELRNGERLEVDGGGSSDLGSGMRSLTVEVAERGELEVAWDDVTRVEFSAGPGAGRDGRRLYGSVDVGGVAFTGFIVWDADESLDTDKLDGEDADGRERSLPIGEVREIRRIDARSSRLTLRDGSSLELFGTNDVDDSNRGLTVTQSELGHVSIAWREVDHVTFSDPPPSPRYDSFDGGGLIRGTLHLRDGSTLRGAITWDDDETHTWETIDGEADRVDYSVAFARLAAIRRLDARRSELTLRGGRTLVLSGTNDVDDDNRGILVTTEAGATHELAWPEVTWIEFQP